MTHPLEDADLAWLRERVRWRLARGWPLRGLVTYTGASRAQREALARLLGRPPGEGPHLSVALQDVDAALRRQGATGLDETVGATARGEAPWTDLRERVVAWAGRRPALAMWAEDLAATGTLRAVAGDDPLEARRLLDAACAVLDLLPARGIAVADLAAEACGDPGALSDGTAVARLVLPAAALLGGVPPGRGRRWARETWAAVGVVPGDADETVRVLGLVAGGAAALSLRELVTAPPGWQLSAGPVSVCGSARLLEAAAAGGVQAPLVCLEGQPGAAAATLLRRLADAGARFRVHADFDWPGVTAANAVIRRVGAEPWRLDAATYERFAADAAERLRGAPVAAAWDADLAPTMRARGRRVPETHMVDVLLADLAD